MWQIVEMFSNSFFTFEINQEFKLDETNIVRD